MKFVITLLLTTLCLVGALGVGTTPAQAADGSADVQASDGLVSWALHWRDLDVRATRTLNRWRAAFGRDPVSRVAGAPQPRAFAETWTAAGRAWKAQARDRFAAARRLRERATHPGGSGAARWLPLAFYVGWPRAEAGRLVECMTGESGGRQWVINRSSGYPCVGVMQILCYDEAQVRRMLNPLANLRQGLRMWRERWWRPWSAMRAYW